jgi:hypothetical protein
MLNIWNYYPSDVDSHWIDRGYFDLVRAIIFVIMVNGYSILPSSHLIPIIKETQCIEQL